MLGPEAAAQRGGRRCRGRAGPRGQHGPLRLLAAGRGGTLPPAGVVPAPEQRPRDGAVPGRERAGAGRRKGGAGLHPAAPGTFAGESARCERAALLTRIAHSGSVVAK